METFTQALSTVSDWVWGPVVLALLLGTGLYLTLGLRGMPQRKLGYGFAMLFSGRRTTNEPGDITPFQALATALSATVGTGNIAGVATAIHLGGPGAIFWMWITALVGMATKYGEAVLAVNYRETNRHGDHVGGPMYYIANGLGRSWRWLALLFALFATVAAFGIGNMVQSNSVSQVLSESRFAVPTWITGLVLAAGVAIVVLGGVRRLARVTEKLVPFMAVVYVIGALAVLALNAGAVPGALVLICQDAFTGSAATGGFAGAGILMAIRYGVARGIFSNEAGLGSAPIAHAAARTNSPVRQGVVAMLGTFIDTIIVCTLTALVIVATGTWSQDQTGAALSATAFTQGMPGPGGLIVSFGLVIFAFSTMLAWSYYGERTAEYLFGSRIITPYRVIWVVAIFAGAVIKLDVVWLIADIMNALMAIPNLIALLLLSPVIFRLTRRYFDSR
ncbi:sodium:alanine symporter family protein [Salinisphaera sp. Q1T1-3]|uniref:alanine/glycine:cation symporter family protein n=1 Tax=Salinisphaera sp. Q1T1-3 TaxID=2321229 RepID=UPI000E747002|nr:sodium:alanine symporter family protein [Salinisphaera sp. Q1T1-3]RJS94679.1 sodium:alanine symporter family protein [Salinisphaera sp. Q1T1-3]